MTDGWIAGESFILLQCQNQYQTLRPDKNFRTYGNLTLYLMRYTFMMVNLVLASAGQTPGQYLSQLIFQGLMSRSVLMGLFNDGPNSEIFDIKANA